MSQLDSNPNLAENINHSESEEATKIPYIDSKFKQQKVSACKPFLTPLWAAIIYGVFALISLIVGAIFMASNKALLDYAIEYTDCTDSVCIKEVTMPMSVTGDVLFYYELENYLQNHFAYSSSKSWEQLGGKSFSNVKTCKQPDVGPTYVPCGALPMSLFNDTFTLTNTSYSLDESNIAQKEYKKIFKTAKTQTDQNYTYWLRDNWSEIFPGDQTNEHFINWMQISPLKTFRKLYGRISNANFAYGDKFNVTIANNYPIGKSKMKKFFILANTNMVGGKNNFFGYFFIVLCVISFIISIVFFIIYFLNVLPLYRAKKENNPAIAI